MAWLHTEMTFPRADRDLLMLAPSFRRSPVAPVLSALSEPEQMSDKIDSRHYQMVEVIGWLTCQINQVHHRALLCLSTISFDDLIKSDGDHGVSPTAGGIHVGGGHSSTCSPCIK